MMRLDRICPLMSGPQNLLDSAAELGVVALLVHSEAHCSAACQQAIHNSIAKLQH